MASSLLLALLVGIIQGIVEWLPVSSEGVITLFLTTIDREPAAAVRLALFAQAGTALSVLVYYWADIRTVLERIPAWRPREAFAPENAELSFLVVATIATGIVGLPAYALLQDAVGGLAGGGFVAVIGVLLVITGLLQLSSSGIGGGRSVPGPLDSVLVGAFQGLTILPGISRSGTTVSVLLLRRHDGPSALRLSFLLSIPATVGGAVVGGGLFSSAGIPILSPVGAVVMMLVSAVVGYVSIDVLMRVVERIDFWAVCLGLGVLALLGGLSVSLHLVPTP